LLAWCCVFKWLGKKFLFHTNTQPRVQEISRVSGVGNTKHRKKSEEEERERRKRANAKQKIRTIHPRMIDCHPTPHIQTACEEPLSLCEIMMRGYHKES
jgi:hypothetical protein